MLYPKDLVTPGSFRLRVLTAGKRLAHACFQVGGRSDMNKIFCWLRQPTESSASAWHAWHQTAIESFTYCRKNSAQALVFGEAEQFALLCGRARHREQQIVNELASLLESRREASLHSAAHAYLDEWSSALCELLEELQFGRALDADAVILRAQSALWRRWAKLEAEVA